MLFDRLPSSCFIKAKRKDTVVGINILIWCTFFPASTIPLSFQKVIRSSRYWRTRLVVSSVFCHYSQQTPDNSNLLILSGKILKSPMLKLKGAMLEGRMSQGLPLTPKLLPSIEPRLFASFPCYTPIGSCLIFAKYDDIFIDYKIMKSVFLVLSFQH